MGKSGCFAPWESQLQQGRATQPTVHAGYFSVSIIHRTLTWTTGSVTCAQMLMHANAQGSIRIHVRESALKVDSGRRIPCCTGGLNLRQQHDGPMLPMSYIHTQAVVSHVDCFMKRPHYLKFDEPWR